MKNRSAENNLMSDLLQEPNRYHRSDSFIFLEPEAQPHTGLKIVNGTKTWSPIKDDGVAQIDPHRGAPRRIVFEYSAKVHCEKGFPVEPRIKKGAVEMPNSGACLSESPKPI